MTEIIKIETKNLVVGRKHYSFTYKIWRNKILIREGSIHNSHLRSPNTMRKYLKNGLAAELALEDFL